MTNAPRGNDIESGEYEGTLRRPATRVFHNSALCSSRPGRHKGMAQFCYTELQMESITVIG